MEIRTPDGQIIRPVKWRSNKNGKAPYQGEFYPANPKKYEGNVDKIVFRSGMELTFMKALDLRANVVSWSSEETIIPYYSPLDKKPKLHRYFVDMKATIKMGDGTLKTILFEIKEDSATRAPKLPKTGRKTARYIRETRTYIVNMAKWDSARKVCEQKGWEFQILTNKDLRF